MKSIACHLALAAAAILLTPPALEAAEFSHTYDFALNDWHSIDAKDGPLTLHRLRLDPRESRITRSAVMRPYNHEYLQTIRIQLEFTNESSEGWRARIAVRWLDADGKVIDGFSGNERLGKRAARKVTEMSVPTLRYGLDKAETLEISVTYEP